jgi:hypothetical protein
MTGGVFREEFRVETPRLRDPEEYIHTPKYLELRKKLLDRNRIDMNRATDRISLMKMELFDLEEQALEK